MEKNAFEYNKEPQRNGEGKSNYIKRILFVFIILSSLGSIYTYTDYLYGIRALDLFTGYTSKGDYIDKNILQNGVYYTKNSERIVVEKKEGFTYCDNEHIGTMAETILGKDSSGINWLKRDLGPIPIGNKISSYEIYGTKSYIVGHEPYKYSYYESVPQHRRKNYYLNDINSILTDFKYVKKYATGYRPIYQKYKFSRCFSTFDISNKISFLSKEDRVYNIILDSIVNSLKNDYAITPKEDSIKGYRAIIYDVHDEMPMRRVIFCANERMYMLETKSTHNLAELSHNYCNNLNLAPIYKIEKGWRDKVIIPLYVFFACAIFGIVLNLGRNISRNSLGKKIVMFNSVMLFASMIILRILIGAEQNFYPCVYPAWSSMLSVSIFFNSLVISWLIMKYKTEYTTDFIVPMWMKQLFYDKLAKEKSRRLYLSFVMYPVIVLIATPLCEYAVTYAFIITLFTIGVVYFDKWRVWLDAGTKEKK